MQAYPVHFLVMMSTWIPYKLFGHASFVSSSYLNSMNASFVGSFFFIELFMLLEKFVGQVFTEGSRSNKRALSREARVQGYERSSDRRETRWREKGNKSPGAGFLIPRWFTLLVQNVNNPDTPSKPWIICPVPGKSVLVGWSWRILFNSEDCAVVKSWLSALPWKAQEANLFWLLVEKQ